VLEQTAAALAYASAPIAMSAAQRDRVRSRLLARAAADQRARVSGATDQRARAADVIPIGAARSRQPVVPARRVSSPMRWVAIAATILAIGSIGLLARTLGERNQLRESLRLVSAEGGARAAALDSLRATVAERDRLVANLTGPQVAVMTLASNDPASPTGRMFWDQAHDAWVFVGHHMSHPKAGRTYQLWLVTPTSKISAGTFMPGTTGDAMVRATYAMPKNGLAAIAVTDEPAAGSAQPTTEPFLIARNGL
jgi:hypothetical protein